MKRASKWSTQWGNRGEGSGYDGALGARNAWSSGDCKPEGVGVVKKGPPQAEGEKSKFLKASPRPELSDIRCKLPHKPRKTA